jgi:heptaprenyl diphosphate synthase
MYVLRHIFGKRLLGFAGLGCAGAIVSNSVQLLLARFLVLGPALRYLIPPFLASGFITGIALGLFCEYFCRHSLWYARHTRYVQHTQPVNVSYNKTKERWNNFNADELFAAGLLMALLFLFNRSLEIKLVQFAFFLLLAFLSGKKNNLPMAFLAMAGIIFFHLLVPYGKVLAVAGPLRITQGALYAGAEKAVTLTGLLMLSRACIKSSLRLPGTIGLVLGESFRLLELMRERKAIIKRGHILSGLDSIMLEMESIASDETESQVKPERKIKYSLLLCVMVIITAGIWLTMGGKHG